MHKVNDLCVVVVEWQEAVMGVVKLGISTRKMVDKRVDLGGELATADNDSVKGLLKKAMFLPISW